MTVTRASCLFAAGGFAAALGIVVTGQQPAATAVYTLEQAAAGRSAYDVNCRACHLPDLGGVNEAPQLAGGNFMTTWRERTAADLIARIESDDAADQPRRGEPGDGHRPRRLHPPGKRRGPGNAAAGADDDGAHRRRRHAADATGARGRPGRSRGGARGRRGAAEGTDRRGRGEELRAGHRRDVEESAAGRLADDPAELSGVE